MSKFIHALVLERTEYDEADLDEAGQPTAQSPTTTAVKGLVQPRAEIGEGDDYRSAGTEVSDHIVFLPAGTDVRHADAILYDDGRYHIVGVRRFRYGGLAHLEVDAQLVTTTEPLAVGILMAKSTRAMSSGQKARVVLNRKAFHEIDLANTDGLMAVAEEVIAQARPPDAPPYGKGLLQGGGWLAYLGGKKVGGQMQDGRNVSKPRSLRLRDMVAIAGWGFPGRFVELGTVDTPAEPFLTRAVSIVEPTADVVISERIRGRLQGLRDPRAALRFTGGR